MEGRGLPFILVGAVKGVFFQVVFELWCGDWIVHCSFSTWTPDNWFPIFLHLGGGQSKKFPSF